jgi:hypothetical protein
MYGCMYGFEYHDTEEIFTVLSNAFISFLSSVLGGNIYDVLMFILRSYCVLHDSFSFGKNKVEKCSKQA